MYGSPKDFDGQIFVGRTLEMLCVSANQIYLYFSGQLSICVEASYSLQSKNLAEARIVGVPTVEPDLFKLLERSVIAASAQEGGTLVLEFDNDFVFKCYDPTDLYEAYEIRDGVRKIVV